MRDAIARLPASKIREVANAGIGRSDVLAVLVRRERRSHARGGAPRRGAVADTTARPSTRTTSACPSCAQALAALLQRAAWQRRRRAHRRHLVRRQCADDGDADAGRRRRRGGGGGAGVAQPARRSRRSWAPSVRRVALRPQQRRAGGSTWTRCCAAVTPAHARAAGQRTQQPHRLDADARGAAGHPGALPPHRHLDRGRRGLRAHATSARGRRRPASWTSPAPTTAWWWRTAFPRAS